MDDGWHTYWQNPGDAGFPPELIWEHPEYLEIKEIMWPTPKRVTYQNIADFGYHQDVNLLLPIEVLKDALPSDDDHIYLTANWLVCNEICVPETGKIKINLNDFSERSNHEIFKNAKASLPEVSEKYGTSRLNDDNNKITALIPVNYNVMGPKNIASDFDVYPIDANIVSNARPEITLTDITDRAGKIFLIEAEFNAAGDKIPAIWNILLIEKDKPAKIVTLQHEGIATTDKPSNDIQEKVDAKTEEIPLILALIFAFIGGIILNAMPCVLPVLSLKIISAVKKSDQSRPVVIKHGIAYTAGIVLSFLALASLILALQKSGEAIGWGFQMQSPGFIMFIISVFFLLGLNLSGMFEIPNIFGNIGHTKTSGEGYGASFFTGALATLAATPCTVPFMASAVGLALTLSPLENLAIFVMLGLGMASPYLMVTLIPAFSRFIPKPGVWMFKFKKFMAILLYATVLYLLWVLLTQTSVMEVIAAIIFMTILYLAVILQKKLSISSIIKALVFLAIISASVIYIADAEKPHKASMDQEVIEQIAELREKHRAVFVDVTASWCLTCQVNKITTLSNSEITEYFEKNDIALLTVDWTNRDDMITKYLRSLGRSGVPTYIFYPPDNKKHILLPQILTPEIVKEQTSSANSSLKVAE